MPNWCSNTHYVSGSPEILAALDVKLREFQTNSLYEILEALGISTAGLYCRTFLRDFYLEDNDCLCIQTESAWSDDIEVWKKLLQWKYFADKMEFVTISEEPGCEVYINTDTTYEIIPTRWKFDDGCECEYYEAYEEELLIEDINKNIEGYVEPIKRVEEIKDAINKYNDIADKSPDRPEYLWFNEFTAQGVTS